MKKAVAVALALCLVLMASQKMSVSWIGFIDGGAVHMIPPTTTFASPPSSPETGTVYLFTDASALGTCSGSGTSFAQCRWNGSGWDSVGGGGGGGGSITNPFTGGGGTNYLGSGAVPCNKGSVSLSGGTFTYPGGTASAAAAVTQELNIITGLNGNIRYSSVLLSENTIFSSSTVTALNVGIGRSGSSGTDQELTGSVALMQSSGNAWFSLARPQPPILGSANTYTLTLTLNSTGGNISALTAGQVNYEVCGWLAQ